MLSSRVMRFALAALFAATVALTAPKAFAQMKFAVVDVQRAVMETEDGLRAQATLKKLFDRRQRELDARQDQLQRARDDIEKQSKVLSKEALQRRTEEWQRNMMELQGVFVEFNKELQKKQNELTQPILNRVIGVLRQIAAQQGYDGILERNAVPYARSDLDITDRVIQVYNSTHHPGPETPEPGEKKTPSTPPAGSGEKKPAAATPSPSPRPAGSR